MSSEHQATSDTLGGRTEGSAGSEPAAAFRPCHAREEPRSELEQRVVDAIKTVYDPEIPVNIYELGLIYDLQISAEGAAAVRMTLTSPACPVAGSLPGDVENTIRKVEGISGVKVDVTWDPPWAPEMMTDAARLQLGMF